MPFRATGPIEPLLTVIGAPVEPRGVNKFYIKILALIVGIEEIIPSPAEPLKVYGSKLIALFVYKGE
ncbi:MAG: hypothetical protein MZU84_07760 [Sphingobacterium sp.]|nr:hypothetical protein [Sphingobacterium sp.]